MLGGVNAAKFWRLPRWQLRSFDAVLLSLLSLCAPTLVVYQDLQGGISNMERRFLLRHAAGPDPQATQPPTQPPITTTNGKSVKNHVVPNGILLFSASHYQLILDTAWFCAVASSFCRDCGIHPAASSSNLLPVGDSRLFQ